MQITDVFEYPNKTVTRQSSSQRKSRRPSGKLHCLNFVFPAENETLGPVCLGCEASSSSVSLSMLKVPIVTSRTKLITSELLQWKNKRGRDYFTKQKERRHIRGGQVIVGELKLTLSCYLNLVKERDALVSNDLQVLIYEDRVKDEHLVYERERQRDRENLHNFTPKVVSRDEKQILNNGGGFVLKDNTI